MQSNKTLRIFSVLLKAFGVIAPIFFWFTLMLGFDSTYIAVLTFLSALWHELGHISALTLMQKKARIRGAENGFRIGGFGSLGYTEEIIAAAAGPASNILIAALMLPFRKNGYVEDLALINLLTAACNLLPIKRYDGERILKALIARSAGPCAADAVCGKISLSLTVILTFLSLYLMLRADSGYWIFFIFIVLLLKSIDEEMTAF